MPDESTGTSKRDRERVYFIEDTKAHVVHLVRAQTATHALNHLVAANFQIRPAKGTEVAELMEGGIKVQRAAAGTKPNGDTTGDIFAPDEPEAA